MNLRRLAFRMTEIFDYRTFIVATGFGALVIVGFLVYASAQTAHDALASQSQSRKAASRRIDMLQRVVADQAQRIADNTAEQAALRAGQEALAKQVQQLGGQPVVMPSPARRVYVVSSPPASSSGHRASSTPTPRPTPSRAPRPSPAPSPKPTCSPLPILGCVGR